MVGTKIAIIPVWREVSRIGEVISRFDGHYVDEVYLAVDEPTPELLEEIEAASRKAQVPVTMVKHPRRMGIGYAIRRGLNYALERAYDVVVVMAGNGKDNPKEIPRLVRAIEKGYDYVQGSRFLRGGECVKTPILRGAFIKLWPLVWTVLTGWRCTDVTNGFRAYKSRLLRDPRININQGWLNQYGLEYYIHFKALTLGYKFREVPVSKVYPYRHKGGYSRIFPFRDWWYIMLPPILLWLGFRR